MMHRPFRTLMLVAILGLMLVGCGGPPFMKEAPTAPPIPPLTQTPSPTAVNPARIGGTTFSVDIQQAQAVTTVMNMIAAYNAGRLAETLAFFDEKIVYSDCDYRAVRTVSGRGKDEATQWLRHQFADHDRLIVGRIANENPTDGPVVAVTYTSRTSDTLRSLAFPNGIEPKLATKVIFTQDRDRIITFANGPYGGSSEFCHPETTP